MARPVSIKLRIMSKVDKIHTDYGECWNWIGCKNKAGYGHIIVNNKVRKAHVISFRVFNNIDDLISIDTNQIHHKCNNTSCVNPEHLERLTRLEHRHTFNTNTAGVSGRKPQTHCKKGHELSKDNSYIRTYNGYIMNCCRICKSEYSREYRKQKV